MKKAIDPALLLLALAAFLAPLMGGQISTDTQPISGSVFAALFNGPEIPLLSHAIVSLVGVAALAAVFLRRKIIQIPNTILAGILLVFLAVTTASLGVTQFRTGSLGYASEFLLSGFMFFAVVAGAGRRFGPKVILFALLAGVALVAIQGIREYAVNKSVDATWRIFAGWVQPNAVAAMFLIGIFVGLGLLVNAERIEAIAVGGATSLIGLALLLTQSKGALLTGLIVGIVFCSLIWRTSGAKSLVRPLIIASILIGCVALMTIQQKSSTVGGTSSAISRIADVSKTGEQSAGFRTNLWAGIPPIIKANPLGVGLGAYRYYSAMSGLTTQTIFAHQSYLQLAAEASIFAPVLLLGFFGLWSWHVLRLTSKMPVSQTILRIGVFCAVLSFLLHSVIDSDVYYFGIQFSVFTLAGIGLLLSADSVAPEAFPTWMRGATSAVGGVVGIGLMWLGSVEVSRGALEAARQAGDHAAVEAAIEPVRSHADFDGESCRLMAYVAATSEERFKYATQLVTLAPNTSNLRLFAQAQIGVGQFAPAMATLKRAIALDPNNLSTLTRLADVYDKLDQNEDRKNTLMRLVDVEKTNYFKIRSLPEFVPTETYSARFELAKLSNDPKQRIALLQPSLIGFGQYRDITIPRVTQMAKAGAGIVAGEDPARIERNLRTAIEVAKKLQEDYRTVGDVATAESAAAEGKAFEDALANLLK